MRIQQLHYIIKIVETGSMNEAAKQLFITQPSLSNAVRDLEREMGIEIFIRNPKGITLTIMVATKLEPTEPLEPTR